MEPITFTARKHLFPTDASVDFGLQLVGSLAVHSLTTMPMLPWVVAEVRRLSGQSSRKEPGTKQVRLAVSPSGLRCEPEPGKSQQWDPLICSSIFECKPQHVHKLIHNSHDPSYFACLIKDKAAHQQSICYVFKADDQTKATGYEPGVLLGFTKFQYSYENLHGNEDVCPHKVMYTSAASSFIRKKPKMEDSLEFENNPDVHQQVASGMLHTNKKDAHSSVENLKIIC